MTSRVSISVIVRTLGRIERVGEAFACLANQTRRDFEVVIVDMSAGSVKPVLENYRDRLPVVQHLPVGRPLPRSDALNQGILSASADKIAILDDDNLYDPIHLEVLVDGLERTGADLVYTGVRRATYTRAGQLLAATEWHDPYDFTKLLLANYIHTSGTAFLKRTWERLGGYDSRFPVYEDYDFLIRVGGTGRIERLAAITAESRSYTGKPGLQNHALETEHVDRCRAGIYWLHRKHYTRERRAAYREILKARTVPMPWSRGAQLILGLVGWWWFCALPYQKERWKTSLRRN